MQWGKNRQKLFLFSFISCQTCSELYQGMSSIHVGPPEEIKVLWALQLAVDFSPSPQCLLETKFLVVGLKNYQYLACMTSHSHQFQPK